MDIDWDLYKYFYYVCEYKNITKVAEHFYLTQPAITKKIKKLEQQLCVNLIRSSNKGIQITNEGNELYKALKPAFEIFNDVELHFLKPISDGERSIRLSASYIEINKVLLPAISKFNIKYPNVKFKVETSPFEDAAIKLREGKLDLLFYGYDRFQPDSDKFLKKECYKMNHGFVISSKLKNDFSDKISIYDINNYPLLLIDSAGESRMQLESILNKKNIKVSPKREFSTFWALKNAIENNNGIGFLDLNHVKEELDSGKLIQIPTFEEIPQISMFCSYQKNNYNKKIIQEFINSIKSN